MAKKPKLKNPLLVTIIRVIQGILIGAGAILPGISGGVLCVVFGIYRPMMALLAHPKENLPRYGRMLLPVGVGWVLGFAVFAWLIKILFDASETMAVILFIGLIAGTIPSLYREAGKMGRSKSGYLGMIGGFLVLFTFLLWVQNTPSMEITPSVGWFFFCGIFWGLSTIIPGMTSSSILISLGLFEPLVNGMVALDMGVIVPGVLGIVIIVIMLSRAVNALFQKYYTFAFHTILGIVLASTVVIVPLDFISWSNFILRVIVFAIGFVIAWAMDAFGPKMDED